jgi:hypothetical protein
LKKRLLSLLKSEEKDSQVLNELKAMLTINVEKYLKTQFIHKLALIFYPKRKDLKILNESDREEVIEFTKISLKMISTNSLNEKKFSNFRIKTEKI